MTARIYETAEAFRQALEQRLRSAAETGVDFERKRQLLVFDRFLARMVHVFRDAVVLKGGLVLELRLQRARTTKDVDLRLTGSPENLLAQVQLAGRHDFGDFMVFEVAPDADHPEIQNDAMLYDGLRFRAVCKVAGKLYGRPFGVDVAFGDPLVGAPDLVAADDTLAFAGIAPPLVQLYPIETHIAEKLHAYTMPRKNLNSRVKDLPDLALLATIQPLSSARIRTALDLTFSHRKTHPIPGSLPDPPGEWQRPYMAMAQADQLPWSTVADVVAAVRAFLDPALSGQQDAAWNPVTWSWRKSDDEP